MDLLNCLGFHSESGAVILQSLHIYYVCTAMLQSSGCFSMFRRVRNVAAICFVMSVLPSTWNNSVPTGRIFMKFGIWVFFENVSRKFAFH